MLPDGRADVIAAVSAQAERLRPRGAVPGRSEVGEHGADAGRELEPLPENPAPTTIRPTRSRTNASSGVDV